VKRQQAGLTLIELLVAMALIGIVFAMITNWQVSTLNISTRTNAVSQRLSDLNDVTGYVGDRVRSGVKIETSPGTGTFTVNGQTCDATSPCLAVLVPEEVTASGSTTIWYRTLIYRLDPRSEILPLDGVADSWATDNVRVLREYRGSVVSSPTLTFSSLQPYLVTDYLTPANELGSGVVPFAYDATTKSVKLAFQTKQQVRGQTQFTPATPYTLTVQARNVP